MSSDRTQFKQVVAGSIGDSRTLSSTNPLASNGVVAQDAQRFQVCSPFGVTAGAANTNYVVPVCRLDRPVQIKEVRILPGGSLTHLGNSVLSYGYTNDGGGAFTTMGSINTNTVVNGGTGDWSAGQSITITPNTSVNSIVPSGSQIQVNMYYLHTTSEAWPAQTMFQVIWEEV